VVRRVEQDTTQHIITLHVGMPFQCGLSMYADVPGTEMMLNQPNGLSGSAVDDTYYIADTANHCIRFVDNTINNVNTAAGQCGVQGRSGIVYLL
jgi:hypothetical protein